uniref:Uncharacterized protein n=1 Tax=Arion vulgaris TaxID=1028688 RepID=A0A0B6ZES5_9EUPU
MAMDLARSQGEKKKTTQTCNAVDTIGTVRKNGGMGALGRKLLKQTSNTCIKLR